MELLTLGVYTTDTAETQPDDGVEGYWGPAMFRGRTEQGHDPEALQRTLSYLSLKAL